jgi:hypothetical protein
MVQVKNQQFCPPMGILYLRLFFIYITQGVKKMSSILAPPPQKKKCGGGGGGCGLSANECSLHMEPKIYFGDLTPYLTYDITL